MFSSLHLKYLPRSELLPHQRQRLTGSFDAQTVRHFFRTLFRKGRKANANLEGRRNVRVHSIKAEGQKNCREQDDDDDDVQSTLSARSASGRRPVCGQEQRRAKRKQSCLLFEQN